MHMYIWRMSPTRIYCMGTRREILFIHSIPNTYNTRCLWDFSHPNLGHQLGVL